MPSGSATATNEKALANLKPWKPGQSGNPKGRPEGVEALARQYTPEAIRRLVRALDDNDSRVAVTAAGMILDRGWGKPKQEIASEHPEGVTFLHLVAMRAFSDELNAQRVVDGNVSTDTSDNTDVSTPRNLMEPATE
jgi:hypothetical protein